MPRPCRVLRISNWSVSTTIDCKERSDQRDRALCAVAASFRCRSHPGRKLRVPCRHKLRARRMGPANAGRRTASPPQSLLYSGLGRRWLRLCRGGDRCCGFSGAHSFPLRLGPNACDRTAPAGDVSLRRARPSANTLSEASRVEGVTTLRRRGAPTQMLGRPLSAQVADRPPTFLFRNERFNETGTHDASP